MRIHWIASLPSNEEWIDKDEIMLHSCFQLLKDCVEQEQVNYEAHRYFVDETRFLYQWWLKRVKLDNSDEDDEMLIRLMKIRRMLWT